MLAPRRAGHRKHARVAPPRCPHPSSSLLLTWCVIVHPRHALISVRGAPSGSARGVHATRRHHARAGRPARAPYPPRLHSPRATLHAHAYRVLIPRAPRLLRECAWRMHSPSTARVHGPRRPIPHARAAPPVPPLLAHLACTCAARLFFSPPPFPFAPYAHPLRPLRPAPMPFAPFDPPLPPPALLSLIARALLPPPGSKVASWRARVHHTTYPMPPSAPWPKHQGPQTLT